MAELPGPAQPMRRAKGEVPQLVIDPDAVALDPRSIVVKHTSDGGYFCLGLGPSAAFLDALDEHDDLAASLDDAAMTKRNAPLLGSGDPFLRRLGTAVALAKDFDPSQPRDEQGRWTSTGKMAASIAESLITPSKFVPQLQQFATRVLSGTAAVVTDAGAGAAEAAGIGAGAASAGAALAFGLVVIPSPFGGSMVSSGTVRGAPDLGYSFDRDTDVLTLTRTNADHSKEIVYRNGPATDGLFRDQAGNVVGRRLDGSMVIDLDAVAGYESRAKDKDRSRAGAKARADAVAKTDDPRLCPDPGDDTPGWWTRSEQALAYQEQISHLPRGFAVELNGVSYDGCEEDGPVATMLDAKAQGYAWALKGDGTVRDFYTGFGEMMEQAQRQVDAAGGRPIEWYFAEKPVADYMAKQLRERYPTIKVIWQPPLKGNAR